VSGDIVDRLRAVRQVYSSYSGLGGTRLVRSDASDPLSQEAADELTHLRAEVEALRDANRTFATNSILPDHLTIVEKAEVEALRAVANNFEITGPDEDGLVWLILRGRGTTGRALFNIGTADRIVAQVAMALEQDRRAAIAKAEAGNG
jgi:hypothetical protein